jgi:hypothetical protein
MSSSFSTGVPVSSFPLTSSQFSINVCRSRTGWLFGKRRGVTESPVSGVTGAPEGRGDECVKWPTIPSGKAFERSGSQRAGREPGKPGSHETK